MKNVLITGGTKGLGKKLVQKYLDEGYNVFATYHNKEYEKIDNVTYLELDLDNNNSIDNLINTYYFLMKTEEFSLVAFSAKRIKK